MLELDKKYQSLEELIQRSSGLTIKDEDVSELDVNELNVNPFPLSTVFEVLVSDKICVFLFLFLFYLSLYFHELLVLDFIKKIIFFSAK